MSALKALQESVYSTLNGDATLTALAPVFNDVPEGQAYPHVQIGTATERPWHTMGGPTIGVGWNTTLSIHIWSRYQGDFEALTILERVVALLNFTAIAVTGYPSVLAEYDSSRLLIEAVNKIETRHVPALFRFRVHT